MAVATVDCHRQQCFQVGEEIGAGDDGLAVALVVAQRAHDGGAGGPLVVADDDGDGGAAAVGRLHLGLHQRPS